MSCQKLTDMLLNLAHGAKEQKSKELTKTKKKQQKH